MYYVINKGNTVIDTIYTDTSIVHRDMRNPLLPYMVYSTV